MVDDDDDFDESALPSFSGPSMGTDITDEGGKGKGRAPEQLAPPSGTASSSAGLSGNIGSSSAAAAAKGSRRTVGGVQVENRYVP